MECKFVSYCVLICRISELIDTLWNVNICFAVLAVSADPELIDTLWNVNLSELIHLQYA